MITKVTIYGERCSGTNYLEDLIKLNFDCEITWKYGWKHFFGFSDLSNSDDTLFICISREPYLWFNSLYRTPYHLSYSLRNNVNNFLNNRFFSFDDNNKNIDETKIMINDKNIYTKEFYKNIFEMRHIKLKFLIEDMPKKVKNYIFIKYEDLLNNFEKTMIKIRDCGLRVKDISTEQDKSIKEINNLIIKINKCEHYKIAIKIAIKIFKKYIEEKEKEQEQYNFTDIKNIIISLENIKKKYTFPINIYINSKFKKIKYVKNNNNPISKKQIFEHQNFNPYYEKILGYI